jgi:hypothetical protein
MARKRSLSPLRSKSLARHLQPERHPPTYLLAAGFDDLRPTLPHGLVNIARVVPEARRALRTAIATVARAI